MKYMGSKNRHAKEILDFIGTPEIYVEPFCGGCNIIDKVKSTVRIGADLDIDLITLWRAVSDGWLPPTAFSEEEYNKIKTLPPSAMKGYAAFALSYGGKKFGGWCRDSAGKRNYVDEAYRNAYKQFPLLRGVKFHNCSYDMLYIPDGSTVYCDPPYFGTTKYGSDFNHDKFWDWVRDMSKRNTVLVSEYNAPIDFKCVWEKSVKSSLTSDTGSKIATEKLFIWRNN